MSAPDWNAIADTISKKITPYESLRASTYAAFDIFWKNGTPTEHYISLLEWCGPDENTLPAARGLWKIILADWKRDRGGRMTGWIGVDLDGTLAVYDGWRGEYHIGAPIPLMVERVRRWLEDGKDVRIFTARAYGRAPDDAVIQGIRAWAQNHIGFPLQVTCQKDYGMAELWDDRAIRVEANTGKVLS